MGDKTDRDEADRDKLLRDIEQSLWQLPVEVLRELKRVMAGVAKGTGEVDQEPQETDQERGERLGTRVKHDSPFGKGPGGGLYHVNKQFERGFERGRDDD